jgi:hypothetical protein
MQALAEEWKKRDRERESLVKKKVKKSLFKNQERKGDSPCGSSFSLCIREFARNTLFSSLHKTDRI